MALEVKRTQCCGMREITNLSHAPSAAQAMQDFVTRLHLEGRYAINWPQGWTFSLVVFTGVVGRQQADHASDRRDNYGQAFATMIEANRLGSVTATPPMVNPNTGNTIQAWIWGIDREAFAAWIKANWTASPSPSPYNINFPESWGSTSAQVPPSAQETQADIWYNFMRAMERRLYVNELRRDERRDVDYNSYTTFQPRYGANPVPGNPAPGGPTTPQLPPDQPDPA